MIRVPLLALAATAAAATASVACGPVAEPRASGAAEAQEALGSDVPRERDVHRAVGDAVARVTAAGELVLERGRERTLLDHDVIPEIDARGTLLVYAKGAGDDAGLYVIDVDDTAAPRFVTPGLAFADRPLFRSDTDVVVAGAVPSGIAGIWIAHLDGRAPTPVTNAQFRAGKPFVDDPAWVPPPASHESMRLVDGGRALAYFDGREARRVGLDAARERGAR